MTHPLIPIDLAQRIEALEAEKVRLRRAIAQAGGDAVLEQQFEHAGRSREALLRSFAPPDQEDQADPVYAIAYVDFGLPAMFDPRVVKDRDCR
jgi:hypothetical protein